jgi:hypothetical protein
VESDRGQLADFVRRGIDGVGDFSGFVHLFVGILALDSSGLRNFLEDAKFHLGIDKDGAGRELWLHLIDLAEAELLDRREVPTHDGKQRAVPFHPLVKDDVQALLQSLSLFEIRKLLEDCSAMLLTTAGQADPEYWEEVQKQGTRWMWRKQIDLCVRLILSDHLKREDPSSSQHKLISAALQGDAPVLPPSIHEPSKTTSFAQSAAAPSKNGNHPVSNVGEDPLITEYNRLQETLQKQQLSAQDLYRMESNKHLRDGEFPYNELHVIPELTEHEREVPLFWNRKRTGYEWNKYNQSHYDADHPPPKVTWGYRFNIFFTDVPSDRTPKWKLLEGPTPATRVLRFEGGAPYAPIQFLIEDGVWEKSSQRGFRSSFENSTLRLYFDFKRERYRR